MPNKRMEIIDTAINLFNNVGGELSARDITNEVKCSHTLIFAYFGSMDGLKRACFDEICHRIMQKLTLVQKPQTVNAETVDDYFVRLLDAYLDYLNDHPTEAHVYYSFTMMGYKFPSGCYMPEELLKRIVGPMFPIIAESCPDYMFHATYILAITNGVIMSLHWGNLSEMDGAIDRIKEIMHNGFPAHRSKNPPNESGDADNFRP